MIVYHVYHGDGEYNSYEARFLGVFSSREKAKEACQKFAKDRRFEKEDHYGFEISEVVMDEIVENGEGYVM
jgi:hypothetical protein